MCPIRLEEKLCCATVTEVASNYRGIALGSCVAKVFTRCLTRRLGEFAEERILTEEGFGERGAVRTKYWY